jgi:acyl carrier protein
MWLLNADTFELKDFIGTDVPPYAILSHTWGPEEVSFVEMKKPKYRELAKIKPGFSKIQGCCARAKKDGYAWVWVDSCCIDKRSSAELSEAINSMFRWYKCARVCYVYLSDVSGGDGVVEDLANSRWFTRGWTLQELLSPRDLLFFAQDWTPLGYICPHPYEHLLDYDCGKEETPALPKLLNFATPVSRITQIPEEFILGSKRLEQACVSQRMFWASQRTTTRPEDRAYSLMGLFDISMPILYGEGLEKAFMRLQQEIFSITTDQSLLAWYHSGMTTYRLLADSPACFKNSGNVKRLHQRNALAPEAESTRSAFYLTNLGLRITLPVYTAMQSTSTSGSRNRVKAKLDCYVDHDDGIRRRISLDLSYLDTDIEGRAIYMCKRSDWWTFSNDEGHPTSIYIRSIGYENSSTEQHAPMISDGALHPENVGPRSLGIIADVSGVTLGELRGGATFDHLGIDSMMLVEIMDRLSKEVGVAIGRWDFSAHPTIEGFVDFLCSKVGKNQFVIEGCMTLDV